MMKSVGLALAFSVFAAGCAVSGGSTPITPSNPHSFLGAAKSDLHAAYGDPVSTTDLAQGASREVFHALDRVQYEAEIGRTLRTRSRLQTCQIVATYDPAGMVTAFDTSPFRCARIDTRDYLS